MRKENYVVEFVKDHNGIDKIVIQIEVVAESYILAIDKAIDALFDINEYNISYNSVRLGAPGVAK